MGLSMNGTGVLIVSDHGGVARSWNDGLSAAGADVRIVRDGAAAIQHHDLLRPDIILIDQVLPGALNGFDTCRSLRSRSDAVIVVVAPEVEAFDEIVALAVGADHFFAADEPDKLVIARLQSLVRRARGLVRVPVGVGVGADAAAATSRCTGGTECSSGSSTTRSAARFTGRSSGRTLTHASARSPDMSSNGQLATWTGPPLVREGADGAAERIVAGDLEIDPVSREVWVAGVPVTLTRIEFDLLTTLAEQPRRVFTREQLMERAWGDAFDGSHVLDTHLSRLRCKVTGAGGERVAHAVRGVGYRLRG